MSPCATASGIAIAGSGTFVARSPRSTISGEVPQDTCGSMSSASQLDDAVEHRVRHR
jgi:hypothetical protein